jgi:hypothetical protein
MTPSASTHATTPGKACLQRLTSQGDDLFLHVLLPKGEAAMLTDTDGEHFSWQ